MAFPHGYNSLQRSLQRAMGLAAASDGRIEQPEPRRGSQPHPGYCRLSIDRPEPTSIDVLLDGPVRRTAGGPRVVLLERGAGREDLTEVEGITPVELELPLLFDGMGMGAGGGEGRHLSIDEDLAKLGRMRALDPRTGRLPIVTLAGQVPRRDLPYWISDIEFLDGEDDVVYRSDRNKVRQALVVTVTQYVEGRVFVDTGAGPAGGFVTVRAGERTFTQVAARLKRTRGLNVSPRELARANAIAGGTRLRKGQRLRLPR